VSLTYEPDYDSKEDVHPEYSTLVRVSYEKLFGALLEAELDREAPINPTSPV
jgi:hypothetical protein